MRFHIVHDWGRWGDPFDSVSANEKKCQARRCSVCGLVEVRKMRSPWNWWFRAQQAIESLKAKDKT